MMPTEEIANGIREVLLNQISLPKNELIRETSRLFGYNRLGANVELAMAAGLEQRSGKTMSWKRMKG